MEYEPLIDIAILGGLLLTLSGVLYLTRGEDRGATPASRQEIEIHQKVRRIQGGQR